MGDARVLLHGHVVGRLSYDRGGSVFRYDDDLSAPGHRVLGQIFEDDPAMRRTKLGLPDWFANLLPEGALRRQIVREMGGGNPGDYTLLLRLGRHLPGAVSVVADSEPEGDVLDEADAQARQTWPLRHSLAGFQLKFSVATEKLTIPVRESDGGWWIAKLPDPDLPNLPLNEYLTMSWLTDAGFNVPPVHLVPAGSIGTIPEGLVAADADVYLTRRFDRSAAGPVHVEDFAQIADVGPKFKYSESGASYETVGATIGALVGVGGFDEYLRRLVAMLLTGNTDAHLKNWALIYPDGRQPELAPVYDFHSLTVYTQFRYGQLALSLNDERTPNQVDVEDIRQLADACGYDAQRAADTVGRTVDALRTAWVRTVRGEAKARFAALADHIDRRLRELPICG
jgi:serine/threonine-protein kinase HipA